MKKSILLLTVCLIFSMVAQLQAAGLYDIIRAYQEGAAAGRQADIEQEQLESMRLENERLRMELDGLRQNVQREQEEKARIEKEAREKESLEVRRQKAFEYFVTHVKPKIVKVHPDFDSIMMDKAYWDWAGSQRPALKFAAENSPDPDDIIWALNEYKKGKRTK